MPRRRKRHRSTALDLLVIAAVVGIGVGVGSVGLTSQGRMAIATTVQNLGSITGAKRRRSPQPGDYWSGCNDARDAGTAPIYRDEPGYREDMDGDSDGIACEAVQG